MLYSEKIVTRHGTVEVEKKVHGDITELTLNFQVDRKCVFHWGLSRIPSGEWLLPPEEIRPEKTIIYDDHAVRTPISPSDSVQINVSGEEYAELAFVLHFPEEDEWDNNHGKNYRIRIVEILDGKNFGGLNHDLQNTASEIIEKETSGNSWTLMHRYNLCYELLERSVESRENLALLFVWLRFSALRQLDWQRNYNTKPRELSHAQNRLTQRLTRLYTEQPAQRELVRLMLTTMGHGAEGQRIRDEILEIMHRYRIREVSEIFMEQWHQKMHNNTTPDDIVICEAYLAFLRSNGNQDTFYRALENGGVSRERLKSFERPIIADPGFYPDRKDAMILDFEHFLGTLKSVHSAIDLGASIHAARHLFDDEMHQLADFIWRHRDDSGEEVISLLEKVTMIRRRIITGFDSNGAAPELLCLDIAMENFIRSVIEKNIHEEMTEEMLFEWLNLAMQNFLLIREEQDLSFSLLQWDQIRKKRHLDRDLTLQADSVLDRIERAVGDYAQGFQDMLQPKAELLGKSFHAEPWIIRLFSEEVLRGGLIFAISILSRRLRRLLREGAMLSFWQLASRGGGKGEIRVMDSLDSVQGQRFDPPVIIISSKIRGDEDLPEGALAVLTQASVDVVSHLAIRARNQGVLLATCYDEDAFEKMISWNGRFMEIRITASGEVRLDPAEASNGHFNRKTARTIDLSFTEPIQAPYAISNDEFERGLVGGKSFNLKELRGMLPGWIHLPVSVALPFGTFDKTMMAEANLETGKHYEDLLGRVSKEPDLLPELRNTVMKLLAPGGFHIALREVMEKAGLHLPEKTERLWECIKEVWASKWNGRAYWNRQSSGIPHRNLLMAVLIQEVIPAEYAYISHTVHPYSGNRDEVYIEVVSGLGETLAGNYPGRALSCTWHKESGKISLFSYPSKSIGVYGRGLIFRSDSNAEDLAGYAGAGLYSSIPLESFDEIHLNYVDEPLVQDKNFRNQFLSKIGELSLLIEDAAGSPQDIEGAFMKDRYHVVQTRPQVGLDT